MSITSEDPASAEFLALWPIARLERMTLPEYSTVGDKNSFIYWLENRLDTSGSIRGGSSFKFGIYSRRDQQPKKQKAGRSYNAEYAWLTKFGKTPAEVFETVRKHVVDVARAAERGDLARIESIPLAPVVKWKIAFHYQSAQNPAMVCIFRREPLLETLGEPIDNRDIPFSDLYRRVAEQRQTGQSVLDLSASVWQRWAKRRAYEVELTDSAFETGNLLLALKFAPFPESMHGGATETGAMGRFRTDTGTTFASDVRAYNASRGVLRHDLRDYLTAIGARIGQKLSIIPEGELDFLITRESGVTPPPPSVVRGMPALNQILYGPPGTGKTYHTIDHALRILDPEYLERNRTDRARLKSRFDTLSGEGKIEFVTFHQSFSYEDFVEGLRAETDDESGQLRYEISDGVFKRLCLAAQERVDDQGRETIDPTGRKIWKLSLGNSQTEQYIFDDCIEQGIALLGFGAKADFSDVSSREDIEHVLEQNGVTLVPNDYHPTAVNAFVRLMKEGDLIVVTEGNLKFRAIGEITGPYRRIERDSDTYVQCRDVNWLRVYRPSLPYDQLMNSRFSQMTTYELREPAIDLTRLRALLRPADKVATDNKRVLIIDEINRGNVSRVFGELITLIEPSKRDGAAEALKVVLPYSKEAFSVPESVHLIGTMNTADRSLAGLDIALRRRFEFIEMPPRPDLLKGRAVQGVDLGELLDVMNQRIEVLLDRDHQLGHAYFMSIQSGDPLSKLETVFRNQIIPLLQEYFFEDWQRIAWVLNDHRKDKDFRFLRRPSTNVEELFGREDGVPSEPRRWRINDAAFGRVESYAGIIRA
ncbi:MAG: AAA family ATPase [Gemmatimonas sp.]